MGKKNLKSNKNFSQHPCRSVTAAALYERHTALHADICSGKINLLLFNPLSFTFGDERRFS